MPYLMGLYIENGGMTQGGWSIIIKGDDGIAFEYQHMREQSPLQEGSRVSQGDFVGTEGTSGYITGLHLHMEMQDLSSGREWDYEANLNSYINPADYMGFPNTTGISVIYNGTPRPPTPAPTRKKKKFNFLLFSKRRNILNI